MCDEVKFRSDDPDVDEVAVMKFFILVNIHKKWWWNTDRKSEPKGTPVVIRKVIYRNDWKRMDIVFEGLGENGRDSTHTIIGEFLEHYHPEGGPAFNVDKLFHKEKRFYGLEFIADVE